MNLLLMAPYPDADIVIDSGYPSSQFKRRYLAPDPDAALLQAVAEIRPEACCVVASQFLPSAAACRKVRESCRLTLWNPDAGCPGWRDRLLECRNDGRFDSVVSTDGTTTWPMRKEDRSTLFPCNPSHWIGAPARTKERDLGFAGFVSVRRSFLDALGSCCEVRDRAVRFSSYGEYVSFLGSCRSVVNVATTGVNIAGIMHVKNRVVEAGLAGCLLFESKGSPTRDWFAPGEDYLEYEEPSDVLRELSRPDFAERAATFGQRLRIKTLQMDLHRNFWEQVSVGC